MTEVVAFPRKRGRVVQANKATDAIDMMRQEAEHRKCSHVFAALVHDDGSVSRWAFSAADIERASVFKDLLLAIDLLRTDAFTTVSAQDNT